MNNPQHGQVTTLVRPLGAAERLFYRYSERNPAHFSIVAEFGAVLAEKPLRAAAHGQLDGRDVRRTIEAQTRAGVVLDVHG
ncbi:hypothetical protein [Mycobacterium sp. 1245852.3]|uniref:hypothetical protein n=1 Tax=Mycobacterium sp. 1245852.3 TaxID=1856860 RepID=UPI000AF03F6B|nr:hypothetical protein [Mycobacterium sp. 1245852.3]